MGKKDPLEGIDPNTLTEEQLDAIYGLNLQPCAPGVCRRNCVSNPWCINHLGEQKYVNQADSSDSVDTSEYMRNETELIGLKNLGATCYVNAYLQVWFHMHDFREAMLSMDLPSDVSCLDSSHYEEKLSNEPPDFYLAENSNILLSLQTIFTLMKHSSRRCINPAFFIRSLKLDENEQQDAQEFSSLFLSLIEKQIICYGQRNVVKELFQGALCYSTVCSSCGSVSETNSKFTEIQLPVQNFRSLYDSLNHFFQEECLENDNQYYCSVCNQKTNAKRKINLTSAPPILNIQLLRFVYDRNTNRKKKITTSLKFPETLKLDMYMSEPTTATYELTAVVLHIGSSATAGHFIAQVRKHGSNEWYEINDQNVRKLKKKFRLGDVNDNEIVDAEGDEGKSRSKSEPTTNKGYMFVYVNKSTLESKCETTVSDLSPTMQSVLLTDEEMLNNWFTNDLQAISDRKQVSKRISEVYECLYPKKTSGLCYISTDMLREFLKNPTGVLTLNLNSYVCPHDLMNFRLMNRLKLVQVDGIKKMCTYFNVTVNKYVPPRPYCVTCVKNYCTYLNMRQNLNNAQKIILNKLRKLKPTDDHSVYVGKSTIKQWVKLKLNEYLPNIPSATKASNVDESSSDADDIVPLKFNTDVCCEHGKLTPDVKVTISEEIWDLLCEHFPGSRKWTNKDNVCEECNRILQETARKEEKLRAVAHNEKEALKDLFYNRNHLLPSPGEEMFLLNIAFYNAWRKFVRNPKIVRPTSIDNSVLLCVHRLIPFDPLSVSSSHKCIWLQSSEWATLSSFYAFDHELKITCSSMDSSLSYSPSLCQTCISEQKLVMDASTNILIYVRRDDLVPQSVDVKRLKLDEDAARSKRTRIHHLSSDLAIGMTLANSLRDLKLKIASHNGILASDQHIVYNGVELLDDDLSISDIGLMDKSVVVLQVDSPRSVETSPTLTIPTTLAETGFKGTALSS